LKLKKGGVNDFLWEILCKYQNEKIFASYYLVGGTALSLLIEHRISTDIDLFSKEILNKEEIFDFSKKIDKNVEIKNSSRNIFQIIFPNPNPENLLKVDFVSYEYPLLEPYIENDDNIRIVGKNDISAMKMSAAGTRGNEARDFIDLYYLLKEIPIEQIVDNFKKKYNTENIEHYLRSMVYFDDVNKESWESVKMIHDRFSPNDVKNKLVTEVSNYYRNTYNKRE